MKLPKLPAAYKKFLKNHDGETEYSFDDVDGYRFYSTEELTELTQINREKVENIYQLKAFANSIREFHGDETEDQDGEPYSMDRLASGLAIGGNNGDVLFLDPEDNHSVWIWHHDGADVERLADAFDQWLELATPDGSNGDGDEDEDEDEDEYEDEDEDENLVGSAWSWFLDYEERILGDERSTYNHAVMFEYFDKATDDDDDPIYNITCLRKAKKLSEKLDEPLFTLWCDAWLGNELRSVGQYQKSTQLLTEAIARSKSRIYVDTPQRLMVNAELAAVLIFTDPIGYEKKILQLCDFLMKNFGEYTEFLERVKQLHCVLNIEKRDWTAATLAIDDLQQHIDNTNGNPYDWAISYYRAKIASFNRDWKSALNHVETGLKDTGLCREAERSFKFIRACALAGQGDKNESQKLYRSGRGIRKGIPDADDYVFCTLFHLVLGDVKGAIGVRLEQQAEMKGKCRYWEQFKSGLHLAELYESAENPAEAKRWRKVSQRVLANLQNPKAAQRHVDEKGCF